MQSHSEGRRKEQVTQPSRIRRVMKSIMRSTSHKEHAHTTRFDSLCLAASSDAFDQQCESFDFASSKGSDESMLPGEGDTPIQRNQSSPRSFVGKRVPGITAIIEKARTSATANA
eukprot:TRINITY_DN67056_c0_g1_i1.p1 TRINITY_DN67056_c0_g1~~TRINITY_DN67056_c0_g1_i1.p1  ORF type:complete len:133 (+),score=15.99 TRINITY_DN67056_c0_g1_i1:56-400(+)